MKLLILAVVGLMVIAPSSIYNSPTPQTRAEQLVSSFLAQRGSYMALSFSNIDTAFTTLDDEPAYRELSKKVLAYEDSTIMFSHINIARADSFYSVYKKLNLQKDSMRIHFQPRPLGYLILHHFQFDGKPWTDSFMLDFNLRSILKIKETIE
ncbi:MAG TPA: hypothetical protein VE978_18175 [Chitinophagales bacterium]|nr:hypothetical protein [Chitinophagales bacterium]